MFSFFLNPAAFPDQAESTSVPGPQLAVPKMAQNLMTIPFDLAREQYSQAVQAGILPQSMLASRDYCNSLDRMEKATLGAWARRI